MVTADVTKPSKAVCFRAFLAGGTLGFHIRGPGQPKTLLRLPGALLPPKGNRLSLVLFQCWQEGCLHCLQVTWPVLVSSSRY